MTSARPLWWTQARKTRAEILGSWISGQFTVTVSEQPATQIVFSLG